MLELIIQWWEIVGLIVLFMIWGSVVYNMVRLWKDKYINHDDDDYYRKNYRKMD